MALRNAWYVKDALETIYTELADDKSRVGANTGVNALNYLAFALNRVFGKFVTIDITDGQYADVAALRAGENLSIDETFMVANTGADTTDDLLGDAKSAGVEALDVFSINITGTGVIYLSSGGKVFDMVGETYQDFKS